MKTDFQFSNLLGTVYRKGNLEFTPDGTRLLSPVGNRVTAFDLVHNTSFTLPLAHRRNVARLALNPQGNLLLSVDDDGHAILTNFPHRIVLHHLSFKAPVNALAFSPSGTHFAAGVGRFIQVWHTPSAPDSNAQAELEFAPFIRHHVHAGHHDVVHHISWSSDSRFFLTSSKDLTARIWSLTPIDGFVPTVLAGHRQVVKAAWFSDDQEVIYTVSKDGALFEWRYQCGTIRDGDEIQEDNVERWRIAKKHFFMQSNAQLTCATYHACSNLLVAGFSNGLFVLYELHDFNLVHTLSISQRDVSAVSINNTAEWLAFGATEFGQLLVWEWRSESYILKQQGHLDSMNALTYSPDGTRIITAADDGRLKVWDVTSGFCIVTFTEHTSGVTGVEFAKRGSVLFTSSLDGSVRAWDLLRYRNFRTFTGPAQLSFSSLSVDPSGEVVCAGSLDSFDIHVWSVQTGALLDQLSGHEGPVSSLSFAPNGGRLVSGSWDRTVRVWDIFSRTQTSEPLQLQSDILCVAFRPDNQQVAVSALDGSLTFWSVSDASQTSGLDVRRDASGGRKLTDRRTAANTSGTKAFHTIAYSSDGTCVLAGGSSKYICLYDVQSAVLLRKFTVSVNLSIDGTQEYFNSRDLTEAGPKDLIDTQGEASDLEDRLDHTLPGSRRGGDASIRRHTRPEARVPAVAFSPSARAFCAASTEGLLIYSLDASGTADFDPVDLGMDVTPQNTLHALYKAQDPLTALIMAFRLSTSPNAKLTKYVYRMTPREFVALVARSIPSFYIPTLLRLIATEMEGSPALEFNLGWLDAVLSARGEWLERRENRARVGVELRSVERASRRAKAEFSDSDGFLIDFLLAGGSKINLGSYDTSETAYVEASDGTKSVMSNGAQDGLDDGITMEGLLNGRAANGSSKAGQKKEPAALCKQSDQESWGHREAEFDCDEWTGLGEV